MKTETIVIVGLLVALWLVTTRKTSSVARGTQPVPNAYQPGNVYYPGGQNYPTNAINWDIE